MRPLLIKEGRLMDPGRGMDGAGSLLIEDGRVSWVGVGEAAPPQGEYDLLPADGLVVCPGFIDLHCHLRQPGFEEKETIATGTRAAARGGFTTLCCMPNTRPTIDDDESVQWLLGRVAEEALVRVLPVACVTRGRKGAELVDMETLAALGVVGFSDDGRAVAGARLMRQALERSRAVGLPVIDHCEEEELTAGGVMNEGATSARLGLRGIPNAAEEITLARDLALARLTGGRLHVAHVSAAGSVALIRRAKDEGIAVTAEATPHHLTLTEEEVATHGANAKVNPPLRTARDVEAVVEGVRDGTIDAIATDHAPHTAAEKALSLPQAPFGISGLETALGSLMGLVHQGRLSLRAVIAALTSRPAAVLGQRYGQLGRLAVGASADIALLDPSKEWVVEPSAFASKGKNTPLAGKRLKGRVVATISGGELVHRDDSVRIETRQGVR